MTLPKLTYNLSTIEFKSIGKSFKFRPMLVREEKLLLIVKETQSDEEIFTNIKRIVEACCIDESFDVNKLPLFELQYAFLQLRIQSIGGVVELAYHDDEDDQDYNFKVNAADVKVVYPENVSKKIDVNDDVVIMMRYPPATLYDDPKFLKSTTTTESFDRILASSISEVWNGDSCTEVDEKYDSEELQEFLNDLQPSVYQKMQDFLLNLPHMHYEIKYKNTLGTERSIVLRTLTDFFTF